MSIKKQHAVVVGAGVVGLTTAIRMASEYRVTVVADRLGPETNSALATAVWHIFLVKLDQSVSPPRDKHLDADDRHLEWAVTTLKTLVEWASIPGSGVELIKGIELMRRPRPSMWPAWMERATAEPTNLHFLTVQEVASFNNYDGHCLSNTELSSLKSNPVRYGYKITVPAACMVTHLDWLMSQAAATGASFVRRRLYGIEHAGQDIGDLRPDIIVNCTGLEAAQYVGDQEFCAFRGEYFVVPSNASTPKCYIGDDDHPAGMAYAIPRLGKVIVGGMAVAHTENSAPLDWEDTRQRASLYFPWLKSESVRPNANEPVVCLRPVRANGVRLETELRNGLPPLIHNYGHGGSGWSMCWGCAGEVLNLARGI